MAVHSSRSTSAIRLRYPPFPQDRSVLKVTEVARCWRVTPTHVSDLIDEGSLQAIDVSAGGARRHWRIPKEAYEDFIQRCHSLNALTFSAGRKPG